MKKLLIIIGVLFNISSVANTDSSSSISFPWHANIGIGYANYQGLTYNTTGTQRIAVSRDFIKHKKIIFGAEIGLQTSLDSRLDLNDEQTELLGGTAVQVVIQPFGDLLVTATRDIEQIPKSAVYTKIGIAYRQMHFDRGTLSSKNQINPEVQVGISYAISQRASISLGYQGIYANTIKLHTQGNAPDGTGYVSSIPSQNGALLIFTVNA
ncbi:MAG: hypothetical protein P1U74_05730 [Legionellaceae bacterium]|nr:hypothetical protein [Legionellaceae bacterium]